MKKHSSLPGIAAAGCGVLIILIPGFTSWLYSGHFYENYQRGGSLTPGFITVILLGIVVGLLVALSVYLLRMYEGSRAFVAVGIVFVVEIVAALLTWNVIPRFWTSNPELVLMAWSVAISAQVFAATIRPRGSAHNRS